MLDYAKMTASNHAPMKHSQSVGVIGAGRWGIHCIRTLHAEGTLAEIAYTGSPHTQEILEHTYPNIPRTTDYPTMLRDTAISAVCIATPIHTHAEIVRDALKAGKHVFVEKPLSLDAAIIEELYALADTLDRTLFTGYLYAYDPAFLFLQHAIISFDEISIESRWEKYGTFDSPLSENLLVHELALCHELLGSLSVTGIEKSEGNIFSGSMRGGRGTAHIEINRESAKKIKTLTVRTSSESLYTLTPGKLTLREHASPDEKILYETTDELLALELRVFIEEIGRGATTNSKRRSIDLSIATALGASNTWR